MARSENLSSVMLGPVPSICYLSSYDTWMDPRHKAEDDGEFEVILANKPEAAFISTQPATQK